MSLTCGYSYPKSDGHANQQVTDVQVQIPLRHEPFGHGAMPPVLRLTMLRRTCRLGAHENWVGHGRFRTQRVSCAHPCAAGFSGGGPVSCGSGASGEAGPLSGHQTAWRDHERHGLTWVAGRVLSSSSLSVPRLRATPSLTLGTASGPIGRSRADMGSSSTSLASRVPLGTDSSR